MTLLISHLKKGNSLLVLELVASLLFALLLMTVNEETSKVTLAMSLCARYTHRLVRHDGFYDPGLGTASFALTWLITVVTFIALRILSLVCKSHIVSVVAIGTIGALGIPLTAMLIAYHGHQPPLLMVSFEILAAILLLSMYTMNAWPFSKVVSIVFVVVHFALWSSDLWLMPFKHGSPQSPRWPGWVILWPGWYRGWSNVTKAVVFQAVYIALAVGCTLGWIMYLRMIRRETGNATAALSGRC